MHFIGAEQSRQSFQKLGFERGEPARGGFAATMKTVEIYYESRLSTAREAAEAIASYQGDFDTCLMWACDLVWGDRSREDHPPRDWAVYRDWRNATGETRTLYEAPGHHFDRGEQDMLAKVIELAIYMGWDA